MRRVLAICWQPALAGVLRRAHAWPDTAQQLSPQLMTAPTRRSPRAPTMMPLFLYRAKWIPVFSKTACYVTKPAAQHPRVGLVWCLAIRPRPITLPFIDMLASEDVDGDWVLAKVTGQQDHGGGAVLSESSDLYRALEQYLILLGEAAGGEGELISFWEGTAPESRESTLRRATLLFAGRTPSAAAINLAAQSEVGLRQASAGRALWRRIQRLYSPWCERSSADRGLAERPQLRYLHPRPLPGAGRVTEQAPRKSPRGVRGLSR